MNPKKVAWGLSCCMQAFITHMAYDCASILYAYLASDVLLQLPGICKLHLVTTYQHNYESQAHAGYGEFRGKMLLMTVKVFCSYSNCQLNYELHGGS